VVSFGNLGRFARGRVDAQFAFDLCQLQARSSALSREDRARSLGLTQRQLVAERDALGALRSDAVRLEARVLAGVGYGAAT
jgi:hypothetical protein